MFLLHNVPIGRILIAIILYILQGVILGLTSTIPLLLGSNNASWKQQGTFSWAHYSFSLKILWAPIIDSVYIRRFGRHQTWLMPIQIMIGVILLILSFYLESLLANLRVVILSIIFFILYFLTASQDIVVDGWTVSLFAANLQCSSTCQTIGPIIGHFIGSTVLMTLESSNFTNKYIREPLSLPHRTHGLFSLQQFILFWAIAFIFITIILMIMFLCEKRSKKKSNVAIQEETQTKLSLCEAYLAVFQLFKNRSVRKFALILLTANIGFAATFYMTNLTLMRYGITRDTLALFNVPLLVVHVLIPIFLNRTQNPLLWFRRGYIPRLIISLIVAIFIFFTPQILRTSYFYPVLIILLCVNEAFVSLLIASRNGFYARISEPRIAGTYMTLLATMTNLGRSASSTIVLYIANWLPKSHGYSIEVAACIILGSIWIGLTWRIMGRFNESIVEEWHLKSPLISVSLPAANSQTTIIENSGEV